MAQISTELCLRLLTDGVLWLFNYTMYTLCAVYSGACRELGFVCLWVMCPSVSITGNRSLSVRDDICSVLCVYPNCVVSSLSCLHHSDEQGHNLSNPTLPTAVSEHRILHNLDPEQPSNSSPWAADLGGPCHSSQHRQ